MLKYADVFQRCGGLVGALEAVGTAGAAGVCVCVTQKLILHIIYIYVCSILYKGEGLQADGLEQLHAYADVC